MKTPWRRPVGDGDHSPVEMRFIDMFMTAIGGLVFIALLLVFLLPKTTSTPAVKKEIDDLKREGVRLSVENRGLLQSLQHLRQEQAKIRPESKRWLGVFMVTSGCRDSEPEVYVRFDGDLYDFTRDPPVQTPDAEKFDASRVLTKTRLSGARYFDIGIGPEYRVGDMPHFLEIDAAGLEILSKAGLHTKTYFGIGWTPGKSYSVYAGLRHPRMQTMTPCVIQPFYLVSSGLVPGEKVTLNQQQPFAWLRRIMRNLDDSTTVGVSPRFDEAFKKDLAAFSEEQSDLLCEKAELCGTMDAHHVLLVGHSQLPGTSPTTPPGSSPEFEWFANKSFKMAKAYKKEIAENARHCEQLCLKERPKCVAIALSKAPQLECSLYSRPNDFSYEPDTLDSAIVSPGRRPLKNRIDLSIEP